MCGLGVFKCIELDVKNFVQMEIGSVVVLRWQHWQWSSVEELVLMVPDRIKNRFSLLNGKQGVTLLTYGGATRT